MDTNTVSASQAGLGVPSAWSEHLGKNQRSGAASFWAITVPRGDPGNSWLTGRSPWQDLLRAGEMNATTKEVGNVIHLTQAPIISPIVTLLLRA